MRLIVTEMFHLPMIFGVDFFYNTNSDKDSFIVKNTFYDKLYIFNLSKPNLS